MSEEVRNDHAGHLILNKSPSVCPSEKQTWYIVQMLFCKKCPIQKGVFLIPTTHKQVYSFHYLFGIMISKSINWLIRVV